MGTDDLSVKFDWEILCKNKVLCTVGWWLTFWAGAMNALTTSAVLFMRIAHLTGPVTDQAKYVLTNPAMAILVTIIIISFITGSFSATKALPQLGMTYGLLMPVLPVLLAAGFVYVGFYVTGIYEISAGRYVLAMLLAFSTGWQNSITSQGRIGRTTHLTGDLTDLGIALAAGKKKHAVFLLIKYSGFLIGGIIGYVGGQAAPVLTMVGIATGYGTTVLVFHFRNAWSTRTVRKEQVAYNRIQ
ncbi:DUF1275 family protein [Dethiobacter alkaliphilus]|uniref:Permease n=1 Tax=Dethiobacter alkaliphilus AHT 1 TaxID=555088 RepID=C0GC17_DETAL|nr:DUF1275 family protein [Dethiobacter alkaliphilus]EEG78752.1 protein of unknown function DUF1275 [Dethiobacter alkaliphilus AHT 1]